MNEPSDDEDRIEDDDARPVTLPLPEPLPASGRARRMLEQADARWQRARERVPMLDLAGAIADRDTAAHGSVLGSALALRLFLFLVPATVVTASLIGLIRLRAVLEDRMADNSTTGEIARAVNEVDGWRAVSLLVTGIVLLMIAGRSLTKVLVSCAVLAWRMDLDEARIKPTTVLAATGILFANIASAGVLAFLRDNGGVPLAMASWVAVAAVSAYSWFLVALTLPRPVSDPGPLLPGAVLTGVGFAALQAVMHVYLPGKVARTSDTFGSLAATIAVLGNLFIIGRLVTLSITVDAVLYERYGSLSQRIFALPVLRRLPARSPRLAAYFDVGPEAPGPAEPDR